MNLISRIGNRLERTFDTGHGFKLFRDMYIGNPQASGAAMYPGTADAFAETEAHNIVFAANVHAGDVVFDVGCNIGTVSMLCAAKGARVYAFDTVVGNLWALESHLRLNSMVGKVFPMLIAVSDENGMGTMVDSKPSLTGVARGLYLVGKRRGSDSKGVTKRIPTFTLDALSALLETPHHVKIDVDGAESAVIAGGRNVLAQVRSLSLEWDRTEFDPAQFGLRCMYERDAGDGNVAEGVFAHG